jgi:MYXO-CTERM domain-containing protein
VNSARTASAVRIDPVTGGQTLLSSGGNLVDPRAIALVIPAQCQDGADNDGDGWTDHPADPGCANAADDAEAPNPQCSNAVDDDGDGAIDLADVHCLGIADASESAFLPPGDALVAEPGSPSGGAADGRIVRVNPATGTVLGNLASGGNLVDPVDSAIEPDGKVLIADWQQDGVTGKVVRLNPENGVQSVLSSGGYFVDPTDLVIVPGGGVAVTDQSAFGGSCLGGCGGVIRVDRSTGVQTVISSGGLFSDPRGLVLEPGGASVLVSDQDTAVGGTGRLIRVDLATGAQTLVASAGSLTQVQRVALDALGRALVANAFALPRVVVVELATGAQSLLALVPTLPYGVAVEAGGRVLVSDRNATATAGFVHRFDPVGGTTTTIAHALLVNPQGVTLVPQDCENFFDDDGDGLVDFGVDFGCSSALDHSERPACSDGIDNEGDGAADFPADPQCTGPDDPREAPDPSCGLGAELALALSLVAALARRRRRIG